MITYLRFRLQRNLRRVQRNVRRLWYMGKRYIRFGFWGKWRQLTMIRRFALGWWFVVIALGLGLALQTSSIRQRGLVAQPQAGGSYSEAVVGTIKNLNPVLPEGGASADANHLIFSGLTRTTAEGKLEPDIAESWDISPDGKIYTFHLRKDVRFHDGVPATAQDVVFTLTAIQNPDTRSALAASWQGVKVAAPDDHTAVFTLPKAYTPFINATTVGLLPRHLLENTEPKNLRVVEFNQKPVGTGPYKLSTFDSTSGEINLTANTAYYHAKPLIANITLRLYSDYDKALDAYKHRQVLGVGRLQPDQMNEAAKLGTLSLYRASVPNAVGVFFKTTSPVLQDKAVRLGLAQATDRGAIVKKQFHNEASPLTGPLLSTGLNMAGAAHQPAFNLKQAQTTLESAGWKEGRGGIRAKNGKSLKIKLVTQANSPYSPVAKELAKQWKRVGADLDITEVGPDKLQQSYIRPRNYDALLYGINLGADPDVYAYWSSSQIKDPGLNISAYSSKQADAALESGRILRDPALRAAKYRSFIQAWVNDTPAVMLYTPSYEYGVDSSVYGVSIRKLISPSDRFTGIEKWSVNVREVPRR